MSTPLQDCELRDMRRLLAATVGAETSIPVRTVSRMLEELLTRRAADREVAAYDAGFIAADKPSPTEHGTLRDEFAGQAMQALIAAWGALSIDGEAAMPAGLYMGRKEADQLTKMAWDIADAMLAQRAKETGKP